MKRLLLLLVLLIVFVGMANAGTYDHSVQISTGQTVIDSVIAYIEVDNTKLDSAKWFVFPVDSFITVPDTAALIIEYRFYYKIDSAAGTYRMTSQLLPAVDKTESVYNNIVGFYVVDTISGDSLSGVSVTLKDAGGNARNNPFLTNSDGFNEANLVTGNWTFIATRPPDAFRDTTINITANDTILIRGGLFSVGSPASADLSRVFGFLRNIQDVKINGATIIATFNTGTNQTDTSGTAVIVTDASVIASGTSDSTGHFFLDLRRSSTYADSTRGYYDIRGYHGGIKLFEVLKLFVPSSGNINLGDTLGFRK